MCKSKYRFSSVRHSFYYLSQEQSMYIKWSSPSSIPQSGCGAWSDWTYVLTLNGQIISSDLEETHKVIQKVDFDTIFDIQVQAQSSGGIGPKSESWIVKSWPKLPFIPILYLLTHNKMETRNLLGQVKVNKIENTTLLFVPASNVLPKCHSTSAPISLKFKKSVYVYKLPVRFIFEKSALPYCPLLSTYV